MTESIFITRPFIGFILIFFLFLLSFQCYTNAHPITSVGASSVTCHGPLVGNRYRYSYETDLALNNVDRLEPIGLEVESVLTFENIWQDQSSYLAEIAFETVQFKPRSNSNAVKFKAGPIIDSWPVVLAQIEGTNGQVRTLFVAKNKSAHSSGHRLEPTHINLIVSLLNALRTRFNPSLSNNVHHDGRNVIRRYSQNVTLPNSLLSPQIDDHWEIVTHLENDHDIPKYVTGWQNVTISSRIYPIAQSKLFTRFKLELRSEDANSATSRKLFEMKTFSDALRKYSNDVVDQEMDPINVHLITEKKPCQPHYCGNLVDFLTDHASQLSEDSSLATTKIGVAYLKLINYIRTNSASISRKDVGKQLKKYFKNRHQDGDVFMTLLDAIAGSRHGEAMMAAFNFLDLTKCSEDSADICERFLVATSITAITSANMGSSYIAEHSLSPEQLVELFYPLTTSTKWADERVKHAFALTLGTLLHSFQEFVTNEKELIKSSHIYADTLITPHSSPSLYIDVSEHDGQNVGKHVDKFGVDQQRPHRLGTLSDKILKYFIHELDVSKDTDARVAYLHALGNARILTKQGILHVFKKYAINSGKRESVEAMKALRDCIEYTFNSGSNDLSDKLLTRLRQMFVRIVYDSTLETTTRIIAAELLANYIDNDGQITLKLIQNIETFPVEMATMIWKRTVANLRKHKNNLSQLSNWNLHSKVLSGSSASFKYAMGGTSSCNASYGVFLELLKGKLPKETNFYVDIGSGSIVHDVINVGLFARGLQSFAGGEDDDEVIDNEVETTEDEESTLAGVSLKVLGNQLRPFLFFRSTSELMGHLWSGAASEPSPVFRANILVADYLDIRPLINGFIVEQSLKGIFSVDLTGEVQVSLWNRNSHSNVQTKGSILFQGSQEIYTTDQKTSVRKYFSVGGESQLNFITDFDFYNTPYRICIQTTQPEIVFRHNTRKYEQIHSDDLHRRIHRRLYKIPAKSYALNQDNNEMCSQMNDSSD